MVSLHNARFIPYRNLTNCQYFLSQNSIVPDIRNYEYGALSTLAVTPNLSLAEIRPWMDRLSEADRGRVIAFYTKWTGFMRDHYDLWKRTYQASDDPGPGSMEIYAHAAGDRGYVFLVNPQYWSRMASVALDGTLGFNAQGPCEIREIYPVPRLRLIEGQPSASFGSTVSIDAPAQQVVILEIGPAPKSIDSPRLYGLPGAIEVAGEGYLIKTQGAQGTEESGVVLLPNSKTGIARAQVREDVPVIPKRLQEPTTVTLQPRQDGGARLDVKFRRTRAPKELRDWTIRAGDLKEGQAGGWRNGFDGGERASLPLFADVDDARVSMPLSPKSLDRAGLGPLAGFCGGYIDNAPSEVQETWIQLGSGKVEAPQPVGTNESSAPRPDGSAGARALPALASDARTEWWLQTRFSLPFMHTIGMEPAFEDHTILALPMVSPGRVKQLSAWINGQELKVDLYRYPRNRALSCYYADLVGTAAHGGKNRLVLHLSY